MNPWEEHHALHQGKPKPKSSKKRSVKNLPEWKTLQAKHKMWMKLNAVCFAASQVFTDDESLWVAEAKAYLQNAREVAQEMQQLAVDYAEGELY